MAQLELMLFGSFRAVADGRDITARAGTAKERLLLAYLILETDRAHGRSALAELFWPERPGRSALDSLRNALARLRRFVGDRAARRPILRIDRNSVRVDPAVGVRTDVGQLLELVAACRVHEHRNAAACQPCMSRLQEAAELYTGPFLEDLTKVDSAEMETWLQYRREQLRAQALEALVRLTDFHSGCGDFTLALEYAERQLQLDPWREAAHVQKMSLLAASGRRLDALRQFQTCSQMLETEFGIEPAPETERLKQRIAAGEVVGPRSEDGKGNLPEPLSHFFGRASEIPVLVESLSDPGCKLLTLTGPGGIGKTALALHVARDVERQFDDGAWIVELASLDDPTHLRSEVASVLGLSDSVALPDTPTLERRLGQQSLLLILDSCEHLIADCARLAQVLLEACPRLCILATSREPLGITAERVWPVPPLELPDAEPKAADLARSPAGALFAHQARSVLPTFCITEDNTPSLAALCRQLDGLPLAIELAASRSSIMSPEALLGRIGDRFEILAGNLRTVEDRHRTIRAVVDWSIQLLGERELWLFRRLAVFRGGWTLEAAEAVCAGDGLDASEILDLSAALNAKSLVASRGEPGPRRFRMLRTIRYAADDLLEASGERSSIQDRHLTWCLDLAKRAEVGEKGPDQLRWHDRLTEEIGNLRAALTRSISPGGDASAGLGLAAALARYWLQTGRVAEGSDVLHRLIEAAGPSTSKGIRAKALEGAGALARERCEYAEARSYLDRSLALWTDLDDGRGQAEVLRHLGSVAEELGERDLARQRYQESLAIWRRIGDDWGIAATLNNIGLVYYHVGDYEKAASHLGESLEGFRKLGEPWAIGVTLGNLGDVALDRGDLPEAERDYEEALEMAQELRDRAGIAHAQLGLGDIARVSGDCEAARDAYRLAGEQLCRIGDRQAIAEWLEVIAAFHQAGGPDQHAAELIGASEALREAVHSPVAPKDRAQLESLRAELEASLGRAPFERHRETGRSLLLSGWSADSDGALQRTMSWAMLKLG